MPTANLRRAREVVRSYCAEIGVSYHETTWPVPGPRRWATWHRAGAPLRERSP